MLDSLEQFQTIRAKMSTAQEDLQKLDGRRNVKYNNVHKLNHNLKILLHYEHLA